MPAGLQIWDASGAIILDTTTYTLRESIYDSATITTNQTINVSSSTVKSQLDVVITQASVQPTVVLDTSTKDVTISGGNTFSLKFRVFDFP